MVILPDGIKIEMRWKSVFYIKNDKILYFSVEPMMSCEAIVYFPTEANWSTVENDFSKQERLEIIFLLERIAWKRKIKIVEVDISPRIIKSIGETILLGSMESTKAGRKIEEDNLFDPESPLTIEQANNIYVSLECKFAEQVQGIVTVYRENSIKNSVFDKIVLPILKENNKISLQYLKKV